MVVKGKVTDLINKWKRKFPDAVSRSLPWDVLKEMVDGLSPDTKLPVDVLLDAIQHRDVAGYFSVARGLDATKYASADLLLQDRLVAELFSKYDFCNSPFNKREQAKIRFFTAEDDCAQANLRLKYSVDLTTENNRLIQSAISKIERILGKFDANEMLAHSRHGPGSTLCVGGPFTGGFFKVACREPSVSNTAFPYAEALLAYDHQWNAYLNGVHPFDVVGRFSPVNGEGVELTLTDYNKVTFVPKNAKTERSIAIEPYFNIYFQLGIGGMIRERLLRCGIDLSDQSRNQMLARSGSIDGRLATIDFSMASDTICKEVVRLLLPAEWHSHLDRLRSQNYLMDGVIRPYHKFSSMGNGYTFELETLIFFSLALAVCEDMGLSTREVSVYGDDVVVPTEAAGRFTTLCNYLGFKINEDKSYTDGFFRESCGEDFLKGTRVRPVFCKELGTPADCASLANRLLELDRSTGFGSRINGIVSSVRSLLLSRIPRDVRRELVGPPSEEYDGYIHTDELSDLSGSEFVKWNRQLYAWEYPVVRFQAKTLHRQSPAVALWLLNGMSREAPLPRTFDALRAVKHHRIVKCNLSDFIVETVPREITGRKIGDYVLGRSLVWSLGGV